MNPAQHMQLYSSNSQQVQIKSNLFERELNLASIIIIIIPSILLG